MGPFLKIHHFWEVVSYTNAYWINKDPKCTANFNQSVLPKRYSRPRDNFRLGWTTDLHEFTVLRDLGGFIMGNISSTFQPMTYLPTSPFFTNTFYQQKHFYRVWLHNKIVPEIKNKHPLNQSGHKLYYFYYFYFRHKISLHIYYVRWKLFSWIR